MKRLLEVLSWYFGATEGRCYPRTPILLPLAIAVALLLVAAGEASAHGGGVIFVRDAFGNVRAVRVGNGFHGVPRGFHNVSPRNLNGGVNRIGLRR